jgi:hypothetical protein
MSKRKADGSNEKPSNEAKMDVDGQNDDSESDDVSKSVRNRQKLSPVPNQKHYRTPQ